MSGFTLGRYTVSLALVKDLGYESPMPSVTVYEAKTHLSRLLTRVAAGEEVVIPRGNRPVARLVPIAQPIARRVPGRDRGRIRIAGDFNAPLPDEMLDAFEGPVEPRRPRKSRR